jgi:uncharacterized membrane protein YcaP (DUF421 family)
VKYRRLHPTCDCTALIGPTTEARMSVDWETLFVPQHSIAELLIRGTVLYLSLFALLRVVIGRRVGAMSMTDLLLVVLIADAAQNGMAGEYKSITEGLVLCATVIGWSIFLDWLAFYLPPVRDWVEPPEKLLVRDGKMNRRNMKHELVTEEELMSQIRQHGIEDLAEVEKAYVEPDGQFSVIKKSSTKGNGAGPGGKKQKRI